MNADSLTAGIAKITKVPGWRRCSDRMNKMYRMEETKRSQKQTKFTKNFCLQLRWSMFPLQASSLSPGRDS